MDVKNQKDKEKVYEKVYLVSKVTVENTRRGDTKTDVSHLRKVSPSSRDLNVSPIVVDLKEENGNVVNSVNGDALFQVSETLLGVVNKKVRNATVQAVPPNRNTVAMVKNVRDSGMSTLQIADSKSKEEDFIFSWVKSQDHVFFQRRKQV